MKRVSLILSAISLLCLMTVGCAEKPQEEATPTPGAATPAPTTPDGSVPGQQEGQLQRFKRPQ